MYYRLAQSVAKEKKGGKRQRSPDTAARDAYHEAAGTKVCPCQYNDDKRQWENHGGNHADQSRSIFLILEMKSFVSFCVDLTAIQNIRTQGDVLMTRHTDDENAR